MLNGRFAVHQKSDGALLQEKDLVVFWGDAGADIGTVADYSVWDPRILYDAASQRWFATSAGAPLAGCLDPIPHPMPKGGTQLERAIQLLKETPLTNQAIVELGSPEDYDACIGKDGKLDPPCLRLLDFKAIPQGDELILAISCYFRSWDLWAGFPTNLGGIELLKKYVADEASLINGPIYAYSAGAHIYGYQEELARIRTLKTK